MAFYKQSISNIENNQIHEIEQVITSKTCKRCGADIDPMTSRNGIVSCPKCGHNNSVMEHNNR